MAKHLQIKQLESPCRPVAICDENGEPLPGQMSVTIRSVPDDIVTATVVFVVGDDVRLVGAVKD